MGKLTTLERSLVVGGSVFLNGLTLGPMKCVAIYFLPLQLDLGASAKQTSLVVSLVIGTYFFAGPVVSVLCNSIGYRRTALIGGLLASVGVMSSAFSTSIAMVYFTLSVFLGFGTVCVVMPTYAFCGQIFEEKRPLVNNIISLGSAVSAIPLSLLLQYWIDRYTWRGSALLLSGVVLNCVPVVVATTHTAVKSDRLVAGGKRVYFEVGLLKSLAFPLYGIGCGLQMGSMVLVSTYLVRYAQSIGIGNYRAVALSAVISVCDMCLRPILGYLFTFSQIGPFKVKRSYLFAGSSIIQSFAVLCIPWTANYPQLVMAVVAYSCCVGFCGALPITVLGDLFGTDKLASSLGLRALIVGSIVLASPPLVGIIVDITGTYDSPFYVSPAMSFVAGILLIIVPCLINKEATTQ